MTFTSLDHYEQFIYTLQVSYPIVQSSTLVLVRLGHSLATVRGEVFFDKGVRLAVRESILALAEVEITFYGYEVWRDAKLLYWYDSQPHPDNPALASTHPHHKHVHPNIKHNRIPAPGLSFTQPNLPFLIEEIMRSLLTEN